MVQPGRSRGPWNHTHSFSCSTFHTITRCWQAEIAEIIKEEIFLDPLKYFFSAEEEEEDLGEEEEDA